MLRKHIYENKGPVCVVAALFLLYLTIAVQIPYMLDDWNWGSDAGIVSFVTCDQNSRFAGNLIILLITRSVLAKNLLIAAVGASIPLVMVQLCGYENGKEFVWKYLLCNILIFLMPLSCWSETYGWASGFANFVTSVLVMLIHLQMIRCFVFEKVCTVAKGKVVAMALFSFVGQMFIENLTVYFAGVYFCLFIYLWIRDRKIHGYIVAILIGILAGSVLMFSSNLYDTLLTTGSAYNGYRGVSVDLNSGIGDVVFGVVRTFVSEFLYEITLELRWSSAILLAVSALLLLRKKSVSFKLLGILNAMALAGFLWLWIMDIPLRYRYETLFGAGFYGLICLNLLVIFWHDKRKCLESLFLWISVFGVLLPLAITTTAGPRLWLVSIVLIGQVILLLADELFCVNKENNRRFSFLNDKKSWLRTAVLAVCLCVAVSHYLVAYASVSKTNRQRLDAVAQAVAEETGEVHLAGYRYTEYLHGYDPFAPGEEVVEKWVVAYKDFYGIPREYELYIEPAGVDS